MAYIKGHHPGTVWLKADLQCHSPRDRSWDGVGGLPGGTEIHEQARQAWANEFVAECQNRSLGLVAITDHHDSVMSSYVFTAGSEVEAFHAYRGLEVTCQDNVQCLVLFDPACDDDIIGKFLGLLVGILPAKQTDAQASHTKAAAMTLAELFDKVRAEPVLERQCVLLPHFSEADAHKNANQEGFSHRFAQLECDGVYIERPFSDLSPATLQKIRGEVLEWGKMRRAVLATGDNKKPNWERLGLHNCWVKVGEHSVEALRQAMLADEARIAFEEPKIPAETISSLTILSSLTGGEPLTMSFNAGFNAIIGGRGSGKSSVIEYIRFGLARTATDLQFDDGIKAKERDEKLIEETLVDGGYVEIVLERDGVQETWRRDLVTRDHVTVTDQRGLSAPLLLDDARRRFRARAFEQKGLSSTMMDKSTAADQITGIAAAEELEQRRHVDETIQASKRSVATELRVTASFWQLQLDHQRTQSRLEDVKARLDANAKKLSEEGMSEDALAVLERAPLFARARGFIGSADTKADTYSKKIEELSSGLFADLEEEALDDFPAVESVRRAMVEARTKVQDALKAATDAISELKVTAQLELVGFQVAADEFKVQHEEAINQQAQHSVLIDLNQRLSADYNAAVEAERTARRLLQDNHERLNGLISARTTLAQDVEARRTILKKAAATVAGHSSDTLMAKIGKDTCPEECVASLMAIADASYIPDVSQKISQWITNMGLEGWAEFADQILDVYRKKVMLGSPPEPGEELVTELAGCLFGAAHQVSARSAKKIYTSLDDSTVGDILAAVPRDFIVLTYIDERGRKISFDKASPGQQASALLELLLRQQAGTLIIDQPEDDLDNKVIMKIVDLIKRSKSNRQLVFATHNPNVVVNGDADKILSLTTGEVDPRPGEDSIRISVDQDGAIETPEVKAVITKVMEGGEGAFDLRRRKYRFE